MTTSKTFSLAIPKRLSEKKAAEIRTAWEQDVRKLIQQIQDWVRDEKDWEIVDQRETEISEYRLGLYTVPVLTFKTPNARVIVEPYARNMGGKGAVEMYVLPTLRRVKMLHDVADVEWQILTDSGISLRQPWNRDTFMQVVNDMINVDL